jgi:acyl-CoA reductase-like NAD-dependent aldehyde dehydrogenase
MSLSESLAALGHLVNGKIVTSEETFPVVNPSTGEVAAHCPDASRELLDEAIAAARAAQPGWAAVGLQARQQAIKAMGAVLMERFQELDELACIEKGVELAAGEAWMAAQFADHIAGTDLPVDVIEDTDERVVRVVRKPIGVVAAISPWNAPILISAEKVFSALLAGNTIVVKPSPFTPLATLKMGELWKDLVPPGVVNILAGGDDLGAAMVEHPGTRMISFTGSMSAGKKIASTAGRQMKNVLCELGGNDVAIVLPDVDVKAVAPRIFASAFLLSGQACALVKRVYVHEDIFEPMVAELVAWAGLQKAAPASDGGNFGPLVTRPQFERVRELVDDARAHGATVVTGGAPSGAQGGFYYQPTIVTGAGAGVRVVDEEQFGPVLPVIPFHDVEDAIAAANATEYGLAGSVWTADIARGEELAGRLECGTTWVNHHTDVAPHIPFGGFKGSGIGRSSGRPGLDAYAELQTQVIYKSPSRVTASQPGA